MISHQAIREFERAFNAGEISVGLSLRSKPVSNDSLLGIGLEVHMDVIGPRGTDPAVVIGWADLSGPVPYPIQAYPRGTF